MSRKTENIYASLKKMDELEQRLEALNQSENNRVLDDIDFELKQEIKNLKFWIDSLYFYNGKSTSNAKKTASRENGKKGGRPPKRISDLKKRRAEIDSLLPQLEHQLNYAETSKEEADIKNQIETLKSELTKITEELKK